MLTPAAHRPRGDGGFTLVELLVALGVLSAIVVAVTAISLTGVLAVTDGAQDRQVDATAAQWSAASFARDVQGAEFITADPGWACGSAGVALLTVQAPGSDVRVTYRRDSADGGATGPFSLVRSECRGTAPAESRVITEGLGSIAAQCFASAGATAAPCPSVGGAVPQRAQLVIDGSTRLADVELDGTRRARTLATVPTTTTPGTPPTTSTTVPSIAPPTFHALGGTTPLSVRGNGLLRVVGNAFVNRPAGTTTAVQMNGASSLEVTGDFRIQAGGTCDGCAGRTNKAPGSFVRALPDPLAALPAPSPDGLSVQTDCPVEGTGANRVRVCRPGIYEVEFPPSQGGGGVKDFVLQPGTYILRAGMGVNNGSVAVDRRPGAPTPGVLLYVQSGSVDITGADLDLAPPATGTYAGILLFQARDNTSVVRITGNARLASFAGTIYAPASTSVTLGGGNGQMRVGRVIGSNLEVFGAGTVIVDGG